MKKTTMQKKLSLNATTVATLTGSRLTSVHGGVTTINITNPILCNSVGTGGMWTDVWTCAAGCHIETHGPTCQTK